MRWPGWRAAGIAASPAGEHGLVLARPRPVHEIPGFDEGVVSVQDAGGAAGGAAAAGGDGLPARRSRSSMPAPRRAARRPICWSLPTPRCWRWTSTRRAASASTRTCGASDCRPMCLRPTPASRPAWWDGQPFDAILLDAPCTASGIVRRHPDVRWLRRESDIAQLAAAAGPAAGTCCGRCSSRAGGWSTAPARCSAPRARSRSQTFVAHNKDAVLRPAPGHLVPRNGGKWQCRPGQSRRVITTGSITRCWKRCTGTCASAAERAVRAAAACWALVFCATVLAEPARRRDHPAAAWSAPTTGVLLSANDHVRPAGA